MKVRDGFNHTKVVVALAGSITLASGLVFSQPALAAPDRTVTVNGASPVAKWDGAAATSFNPTWSPLFIAQPGQPADTGICGKDAVNYCEETVVNAEVAASDGAKLTVTIDGFEARLPPTEEGFDDFDLYVYESDAAGTAGEFVVGSTEGAGTPEVLTVDKPSGFYLVRVVYWLVVDAGYKGTVELTGAPAGPAVSAPGAQPPSSEQTLPASGPLTISFAADRGKRRTARTRGLRARVGCSVQCRTTAVAKLDKRVARRLGLGNEAFTIGKTTTTIVKPGRIPFVIELNEKAKRALARERVKLKVRIAIAVTDAAGSQLERCTKAITLR